MTADRLCLKNRKEKRVERKEKGSVSFLKCERDRLGLHPPREIVLAQLRDTSYQKSVLHHIQ